MDFSQVCVAGPGASGISVDGLPPLPAPDALDSQGQALAASGNAVHSGVNDAARSWAGLSSAYEAPEAGQVLTAFNPVFSRSQDLANLTSNAASVLAAYADRARELKQRINTLRAEVHALDELIGGNDDWHSNLKIVDQHRNTMDKASALAQAILDSDATCATALAALTGGQSYAPPAIPRANLNSSTDFISNGFTHIQHYLGNDEKLPDLPWGPPNISVRLAGPASAAQGFTSALIGAGQGLHTLLLTTDTAKQVQAWQGMFAIGAAALTTKAVIDRGFRDTSEEDINAVLTTVNVAKETIHYDEWGTNPGYAIGATTFDVATLLAGGAGVGVKAGSTAGKLGLAAQRLSTATMDSPQLGRLSSALGNAANGLHRTGLFLDKPGSLALKLSDLVMPSTTAKVLDNITQTKAASWAALANAKLGAADLISGGKNLTADGMSSLAQGLRNADASLPATFHPDPSGFLTRTADNTAVPNWLDKNAASIRGNTPQTQGGSGALAENGSSAPHAPVVPDPFPPQNNITNTVVLQHGHDFFPVSRKDNFAAKTGLEPNTLYIVDNRTKMPDSSGGLTDDSLERFYTDATGRVERVDTYAGVKGAWSVELNKRMPNVTYNVVAKTDGGLENHFTIITDDFAKPKSVEAHITGLLKGDINRSAWQQILAGIRVGGRGYEGGHLIASLFAGPGEGANLMAQLMFQNRGHGTPNVPANTLAFYQLERELMTKALHRVDTGQPLDLRVKVEAVPGPKPGLPDRVDVTFRFDAETSTTRRFPNLPMEQKESL